MKTLNTLLLLLLLSSCASMMTTHRMKAAQRKLLDAETMQSQGRWDEALALCEGMRASVRESVNDKPVRPAADGASADLRPLLTAWEEGALKELTTALGGKDARRSEQAFTAMRQQCSTCHLVLGRKDIVIPPQPVR